MARRFVIFCDESAKKGPYFSNFYGGVLIEEASLEEINKVLNAKKLALNLMGEVKFTKITEAYQDKYTALIQLFFSLIAEGRLKVRLMFTQNINESPSLTYEQRENEYFLLYYQMIKHGFGLHYLDNPDEENVYLQLNFDKLPDSREKIAQFKAHLRVLEKTSEFRAKRIHLPYENISEIDSHKHPVLQCLDIRLGAIQFKLNGHDRIKIPGKNRRGKRTRAKELVYKVIYKEICRLYPGYAFNIGANTSFESGMDFRWRAPYRHWLFKSRDAERNPDYKSKKS